MMRWLGLVCLVNLRLRLLLLALLRDLLRRLLRLLLVLLERWDVLLAVCWLLQWVL